MPRKRLSLCAPCRSSMILIWYGVSLPLPESETEGYDRFSGRRPAEAVASQTHPEAAISPEELPPFLPPQTCPKGAISPVELSALLPPLLPLCRVSLRVSGMV